MNQLFVAEIHNNSLGNTIAVDSELEGLNLIRDLAAQKLGRPLSDEENDQINDFREIYDESDSDNLWTISLGSL